MSTSENLVSKSTFESAALEVVSKSAYFDACESINSVVDDMRQNFFKLGKELDNVSNCKLYVVGGYSSVYDFAEAMFGIHSTTVKNMINVFNSFKDKNGDLDKRFRDISPSTLVELLPLADDKDFCEKVKVLPVKSIKAVKSAVGGSEVLKSKVGLLSLFGPVFKQWCRNSCISKFSCNIANGDFKEGWQPDPELDFEYFSPYGDKVQGYVTFDSTHDLCSFQFHHLRNPFHYIRYFGSDSSDDSFKVFNDALDYSLKESKLHRAEADKEKEEKAKEVSADEPAEEAFKVPLTSDELHAFLFYPGNLEEKGFEFSGKDFSFTFYPYKHLSRVFKVDCVGNDDLYLVCSGDPVRFHLSTFSLSELVGFLLSFKGSLFEV